MFSPLGFPLGSGQQVMELREFGIRYTIQGALKPFVRIDAVLLATSHEAIPLCRKASWQLVIYVLTCQSAQSGKALAHIGGRTIQKVPLLTGKTKHNQ